MDGHILLQNLNVLWASLIIDQLVKNGINRFYISPGNRNAPFLSALARNSNAEKYICIDERGSGYRGLGYAKASGKPAVLVCTSGTALANYYPAVIEAYSDHLPLIVLSSDRPPELTGSDANQTIDQAGFYGKYTESELQFPPPSEEYPVKALLAGICSISGCRRPVHINCRFRDPLVPVELKNYSASYLDEVKRNLDTGRPHTLYRTFTPAPDEGTLKEIKEIIGNTERGLLIYGRLHNTSAREEYIQFTRSLGWPVFCDIGSSLKTSAPPELSIYDMDHPETLRLLNEYSPDTILHLGYGLVSKHFYENILVNNGSTYIQVNESTEMQDPAHRVNVKLVTEPASLIDKLDLDKFNLKAGKSSGLLLESLTRLNMSLEEHTPSEILNHTSIATSLTGSIPENWSIFLGNSLPIRSFDRNVYRGDRGTRFIVNRGVSGIEGNIATALGYSETSGAPVAAVIGDISFLHDISSLTQLEDTGGNLLLVVINNGGGRIFERLPVMNFPEIIYPYSATPHEMDFMHIAGQFGMPYTRVTGIGDLEKACNAAIEEITLQKCRHHFIEIRLSHEEDLRISRERNRATAG